MPMVRVSNGGSTLHLLLRGYGHSGVYTTSTQTIDCGKPIKKITLQNINKGNQNYFSFNGTTISDASVHTYTDIGNSFEVGCTSAGSSQICVVECYVYC